MCIFKWMAKTSSKDPNKFKYRFNHNEKIIEHIVTTNHILQLKCDYKLYYNYQLPCINCLIVYEELDDYHVKLLDYMFILGIYVY